VNSGKCVIIWRVPFPWAALAGFPSLSGMPSGVVHGNVPL